MSSGGSRPQLAGARTARQAISEHADCRGRPSHTGRSHECCSVSWRGQLSGAPCAVAVRREDTPRARPGRSPNCGRVRRRTRGTHRSAHRSRACHAHRRLLACLDGDRAARCDPGTLRSAPRPRAACNDRARRGAPASRARSSDRARHRPARARRPESALSGRSCTGAMRPAAILERVRADVDLLVLGSRAYGPIRRALAGSVSSAVVHHAPCPVLVMPRAGEAAG